jgi:predicted acetylornithine/succinylornithine family transaminase
MTNSEIKEMASHYIINTYGERDIALVRGEGCYVWDADGRRYLDFLSGIAVNALGHCHPNVAEAVKRQVETLIHCSNLYYIEPQARLAKLLVEHSFADQCFFCNSGAEANEAAIKLARKYSKEKVDPNRYEIITMHNSFHGRTLATITATGQSKYHKGFEPLVPGFKYVPFNDLDAVEEAIDEKTCAVMVEPVQSEGGVNVPDPNYLKGLRRICDEHNLLLILDEVQTAMGRLGTLFGYEYFGVEPDIITMAKALGGGVPIGAMLTKKHIAESLTPGSHASTFGGNPLACAAAIAAFQTIIEENLPQHAARMGEYLMGKLEDLKNRFPLIKQVRGVGLIVGVVLKGDARPYATRCIQKGLLTIATANNVIRFLPPLIINEAHIDEAVGILEEALSEDG